MRLFLVASTSGRKNLSVFVLTSILAACGGGAEQSDNRLSNNVDQVEPVIGAATFNREPEILSISLGCDILLESIAVKLGESSTFSLNVDDESPSTLTFSVSSDDPLLVDTSVKSDGSITVNALSVGDTTIPVVVTDDAGNQDSILLNVIVEA